VDKTVVVIPVVTVAKGIDEIARKSELKVAIGLFVSSMMVLFAEWTEYLTES
jgi:hypothetical protein